MTITDAILANPTATDAEIVAIVNDSTYKPVASNAVLEWLGGNGRKAKIDGFIKAYADSDDPNVVGLRAAFEVVLLASGNPTAYLSLEPGGDQRQILTAAVAAGVLSESDAAGLLAKAKTAPDVTEADVEATRVSMARADAQTQLEQWVSETAQKMRVRIYQDGQLPTKSELAAMVGTE